jgi:phosphoserine phosphatase
MKKKPCVTLDFDGTLYPIREYDSEQLLIRTVQKHRGRLFGRKADRLIAEDQAGLLADDDSFHRRYGKLVRTATEPMIDEVAKFLTTLITEEDRQALITLSEEATLVILSCGTENLVESFLNHLQLSRYIAQIRGKRLVYSRPSRNRMVVDIDSPQAKADAVDLLRKHHHPIVAIGDGPTDLPMLHSADLGLVIDWNKQGHSHPFETHHSLASACKRTHSYLLSAKEA